MTASPELHRTLYKLSHWEPSGYTPVDTSGDKRWPAYTTDYLLEKIPSGGVYKAAQNEYNAYSGLLDTDIDNPSGVCRADNLLGALLKLAIRLFEDGVLKAEDKA